MRSCQLEALGSLALSTTPLLVLSLVPSLGARLTSFVHMHRTWPCAPLSALPNARTWERSECAVHTACPLLSSLARTAPSIDVTLHPRERATYLPHPSGEAMLSPYYGRGAAPTTDRTSKLGPVWVWAWRLSWLGSAGLPLACGVQSRWAAEPHTHPARCIQQAASPFLAGRRAAIAGLKSGGYPTPAGKKDTLQDSPPSRTMPGSGPMPADDGSTAPIFERARKLAGLWIVGDDAQQAYLEWLDFCQDWARHRLKQIYFETYDFCEDPPRERTNPCCTAQWTWRHGRAPPYRTTEELDRMAYDICDEAWNQGRELRGHLVGLIRGLQQRGLLPRWFFSTVAGQ